MNEKEIVFNKSQKRVWDALHVNPKKENHYISGLGGGKSFLGAVWILEGTAVPNSLHFIGAPTAPQLRDSTFKATQRAWEILGIRENEHYVIGIRSPWPNVPSFSKLSNDNVITFVWGSYIVMSGLDNFDKLRGAEYGRIWIDEYGLTHVDQLREVAIDRLRDQEYVKRDIKTQILFTATPPSRPASLAYLRKLRDELMPQSEELKMLFGMTLDNKKHLPKDYIDIMRDPVSYRREYEGSLEMPPTNMWYYNFSREKHIGERELIDGLFYIWHDFNKNPGTALIIQHSREGKWIHVHDEIYLNGSDLAGVCQMVKSRYPKTHRYILGGDAMGHAGTHLQLGKTSFKVMLQEYKAEERQLIYRKKNPLHSDSNLLTNAILNAPDNLLKLTISSKCVELLKDLELVGMGQDYDFDLPDASRGHLGDCLRYYLWDNWRDFVKWAK